MTVSVRGMVLKCAMLVTSPWILEPSRSVTVGTSWGCRTGEIPESVVRGTLGDAGRAYDIRLDPHNPDAVRPGCQSVAPPSA
jgi:hypothetical protein